jgi:hypothetical protein
MKLFLVSLKVPSRRFEVVKYDEATQTAICKGQYAPFEIRPFTKAFVTQKGYRLVQEK